MNMQSKRKRILFEESDDDDDSDVEVVTMPKKQRRILDESDDDSDDEDRRRFLGSDTDESDVDDDNDTMDNFIVEDENANEVLQQMLRREKEKREFYAVEDAKRNPPTENQIKFMKKLCAQYQKKIPPIHKLSKTKISGLISTLVQRRFDDWEYGDDTNHAFVGPSNKQQQWMHQICDDLGLAYPENVLEEKYSLNQWSKDIEILKLLKSRRKILTATTWPYGAGSSMKLLKEFKEGKHPDITEEDVLEYMKHYGNGAVKLLPKIFIACHEAYSMSGESWDEMNITAQGVYGNPRNTVLKILRKYNDFKKNSKLVKIPQHILGISDVRKKKSKLYKFWSEKEKNTMLAFDDKTVADLKKESSFKWKSSHFFQACVTANMRHVEYSDDYICKQLKTLTHGGPFNLHEKLPKFTESDIRLGLAKARRYLIICNGTPSGIQNLHWSL